MADSTEDEKPVKLNKWDSNAVKNALDDAVRKAVKEKYKYEEKTALIDVRLFLATISVSFALFALLWDWLYPFPQSRNVLIICVISYFILMAILQAYTQWVEGSVFFVAVDSGKNSKDGKKLYFSSKAKKYDHVYTLEIKMTSPKHQASGEISKSFSNWLDEEGQLRTDLFYPEIFKLHDSLLFEKKEK